MHLVNGTGNSPSLRRPDPGVVKQDASSRGSVDTTNTRSDPQRVGTCRPIGASNGKQTKTMASRQHPPPPTLGTCVQPIILRRWRGGRMVELLA